MTPAEVRGLTFIKANGPVPARDMVGAELIPGVASGRFKLRTFHQQGLITLEASGWVITESGRRALAGVRS